MRIILVSSPSSFTDQLKRAFKANNAELLYLNDRENYLVPGVLKRSKFLWRVSRRIQVLRVWNNNIFIKKLLRTAKKFRPDAVFIAKGMVIKKDTLLALREMGVKTANWCPENINNEPYKSWFLENYKFYDKFFIFDSGAKDLVSGKPRAEVVSYLPFAIEPDEYKTDPISESERKKYFCDVCFVGAIYPERERYLNKVKDMGVDLKIFGWDGWKNSSLAKYYHGPLNIKESVKLYNCAKICLNFNMEPVTKGVNFKTFEIPAAGGFQLSDYRKDVEGLFAIGQEIDVFRNEHEMIEKIKSYLADERSRKNIAEAGRKRVARDHALVIRIKEVINILRI